MTGDQGNQDPGVYLAVERTFLAWIRTGLALMGFGFVVARFGLFLRELAASSSGAPVDPSPFSLPLGAALILTGVVVNLLAIRHYVRLIGELNRGVQTIGRPSKLAIVVAVLLSLAGLAMVVYLGSGRPTLNREIHSMKSGEGIINKPSKYSVAETLDRLEAALRAKGIKVFVRVDHSGEAEMAGLKMPPTQLLIFGNPKGGTPVMLAAPTAAIDLPLKALAWQDGEGKVWLSYNDPQHLKRRFGLDDEQIKTIVGIGALLEQVLS